MFDLTGRRAVVTGASSGIGQAIAVALAQAGADVASLHLTAPEGAAQTLTAIEAAGRRALMAEGDVSDHAQVERFADTVERSWGGIDIWVNNAAQMLVRAFSSMSVDEWHRVMGANLHGYFYGCRAAVPRMLAQGSGRIINISSATDVQPISQMTAYITAKGGVVGLTKALALELGHDNITVNAIAPGATETPLTSATFTAPVRRVYEEKIAVGRVGVARDIGGAAVFLASDAASYITGHELLVDGGLVLNGNTGFAETA